MAAAPGSQYGARSPEKAVTKYTPPVFGTEAARLFTWDEEDIMNIESRIHWMALPATPTGFKLASELEGEEGREECLLLPSRA